MWMHCCQPPKIGSSMGEYCTDRSPPFHTGGLVCREGKPVDVSPQFHFYICSYLLCCFGEITALTVIQGTLYSI